MKKALMANLVLLVSAAAWAGASTVKGDYIEVRSASVFAGACHANGELVTAGNDAIMAWNIQSGQWNGTQLAGVKAIAVLKSDQNLAVSDHRQSEIVVDAKASAEQAAAVVDVFQKKYGSSLGKVIAVRRAPITFKHEGKEYEVRSPGVASLSVEAMPNNECCAMSHLVWYDPLIPLTGRKVGYTKNAAFDGSKLGDPWLRADENSAFYGSFSI